MKVNIVQAVEEVKGKVPIVIIGAGGIVRDAHLPAYAKAGFEVKGVCDVIAEKAEAVVREFPAAGKAYASLEALIEDNRNEEVVYDVAVPADHILEVLEKLPDGVPVLIQKPMGETLKEAKSILDSCIRKNLAAGINFQLKYAPYNIAAKSLIDQGVIGDVYDAEIMVCVYTPWDRWSFLADKPRIEILYHSIHYLDLIRSFLGMPRKIHASTVKHPRTKDLAPTRTTMILEYDEFTQARIITNHGYAFGMKEQKSYFKIEGTKGVINIRIGVSLGYPKGEPDKFEFFSTEQTNSPWEEVTINGSWFPEAFIGPMAGIQRLRQVEGEARFDIIRDNFETMRLVEAAYRSCESGGTTLSHNGETDLTCL